MCDDNLAWISTSGGETTAPGGIAIRHRRGQIGRVHKLLFASVSARRFVVARLRSRRSDEITGRRRVHVGRRRDKELRCGCSHAGGGSWRRKRVLHRDVGWRNKLHVGWFDVSASSTRKSPSASRRTTSAVVVIVSVYRSANITAGAQVGVIERRS